MNYAINLLEYRETREWAAEGALVVPILVSTTGKDDSTPTLPAKAAAPWPSLFAKPITCVGASGQCRAIERTLAVRSTTAQRPRSVWLRSSFSPSSTIIDAALSLYGQHDVAAIEAHAAPKRGRRDALDRHAPQLCGHEGSEEHAAVASINPRFAALDRPDGFLPSEVGLMHSPARPVHSQVGRMAHECAQVRNTCCQVHDQGDPVDRGDRVVDHPRTVRRSAKSVHGSPRSVCGSRRPARGSLRAVGGSHRQLSSLGRFVRAALGSRLR